jgi:muconate cycloisomerase
VKLKGADDPQFDIERAREVRAIFGDRVTLSVDANMSWSLEDAIARWEYLRAFDVAWFEEPLSQYSFADYRTLRERSGARIMLDESLCSFEDGRRAVEAGACDLFNIRISKNGGLLGSLRLAGLAHQHGLGVQLGSHPGQMGILGASGAHFASIVGSLVALEGADRWIGTGGMPERIIREELRLDVTTGRCEGLGSSGLGVTPQLDVIERHAVERARWTDGAWVRDTAGPYTN